MTDKLADAYKRQVVMMQENRSVSAPEVATQTPVETPLTHRRQQMMQNDSVERGLFSSAFAHVIGLPEPCEGYTRLNEGLSIDKPDQPELKLVVGG